ncbi:hypothetical protein HK405_005228, partial [Cladochytrium tenue]
MEVPRNDPDAAKRKQYVKERKLWKEAEDTAFNAILKHLDNTRVDIFKNGGDTVHKKFMAMKARVSPSGMATILKIRWDIERLHQMPSETPMDYAIQTQGYISDLKALGYPAPMDSEDIKKRIADDQAEHFRLGMNNDSFGMFNPIFKTDRITTFDAMFEAVQQDEIDRNRREAQR